MRHRVGGTSGGWFNYGPGGVGVVRYPSLRYWWYRHGRSGGFHHNDLNLVGWAALVGSGVVAGTLAWGLGGTPLRLTVPGGVAVSWCLALVADRRHGSRLPVSVGVSDLSPGAVDAVVARLRTAGIPVTVRRWTPETLDPVGDPTDPRSADPSFDGGVQVDLVTRGRHRNRVLRAVETERWLAAGG